MDPQQERHGPEERPARALRRWRKRIVWSVVVVLGLSVPLVVLALLGLPHLFRRFGFYTTPRTYQFPLFATLVLGGLPLTYELLRKVMQRKFGSDLLGGISIVTSILLGEHLAGSIIVLMLSGGEALESYALRSASSVLAALANRGITRKSSTFWPG